MTKFLSLESMDKKLKSIQEAEFKVFSQFGEDGIIQWLIHNTDIKNKTFVEFGVGNYEESNTRFLLMNDNWSGLIIEDDEAQLSCVFQWNEHWKYDLTAVSYFITKDNINSIIEGAGISGEIGILSVDIDGNDYWVLNQINCIRPTILICEYNSVFGFEEAVTVPYDDEFVRHDKHYSGLYWGASLPAFWFWAETKGDYFGKYSESRDISGQLTYLRGSKRIREIKDLEVFDLRI